MTLKTDETGLILALTIQNKVAAAVHSSQPQPCTKGCLLQASYLVCLQTKVGLVSFCLFVLIILSLKIKN